MSERTISDDDLLAYADGRLGASDRAVVETWLAAHPDKAAEVALWQRQNEAIQGLYAPTAEAQVPARLAPHRIASATTRGAVAWPAMAAAAIVALGIGLGGGWFLREAVEPSRTPADALVQGAVTAHALYVKENRHAVEVAATDREHLVSWLSNRIASPIDAPNLTAEGFALVGGRLLPADPFADAGPAAQLMYENAAAERLTIYITGALPDGESANEFMTVGGLDAFYWATAQITCTVVGDLPEDQMETVARKVYQHLTRRPDAYIRGG